MKIFLPNVQTSPQCRLLFDYTINLGREEVNFAHPFAHPVRVSGSVTDTSDVVRLEGKIEARIVMNCARCNRPVEYDKAVDVFFILARTLDDQELDDIWVVESDWLELDDIFIPELLMDMEMSALCSEDCAGLCPKCGCDLNLGDCGCNLQEVDPRLAKMAEMLDKLKNNN